MKSQISVGLIFFGVLASQSSDAGVCVLHAEQSRAGALVCTDVCLLMLGSVAMEKQNAAAAAVAAAAAAASSVCLYVDQGDAERRGCHPP